MALYRLSASVVSRGSGQSTLAAAAYRAAEKLAELGDNARDALGAAAYRSGTALGIEGSPGDGAVVHDYTRKTGVVHSEIIAPDHAPVWMHDRERLWNAVEASEKRKDAQLAREIQLALPRELSRDDQLELVRGFARDQLVARGMVVDLALHDSKARDGQRQPHAHLLLTMRRVEPGAGLGFGSKERSWNSRELLQQWRERWADDVNRALERASVHDQRVDHRTLEAQRQEAVAARDWDRAATLDREPEPKLGYAAAALERQGVATERGDLWRGVQERNAERAAVYDLVAGFGEQAQQTFLQLRERAGDAIAAFDGWAREAYAKARNWLHERVETVRAAAAGRFAGLELEATASAQPSPLEDAVTAYARAWADAARMPPLPVLPHQQLALQHTGAVLERQAPGTTRDLGAVLTKAPELVPKLGTVDEARALLGAAADARRERRLAGQVERAKAAARQLAAERRATRFVADWRQLEQRQGKLVRLADEPERQAIAGKLDAMERKLRDDPELEATLKERGRQLGVGAGLGRVLRGQGRERSRGRDRGFGLEL